MADYLAELVVSGVKTATCSAYEQYSQNEIDKVGTQWIIVDGKGVPKCVVETTEVNVIRFDDVDAKFAYDEGEGSRSLEEWRKEHVEFFSRNGGFSSDMRIVCERFKVVEIL